MSAGHVLITAVVAVALVFLLVAGLLLFGRLDDRPHPDDPKPEDRPGDDDQFGVLADAFHRLAKHREKTGRHRPVTAPTSNETERQSHG